MITLCARWESTQMSPELEWSMWRQIKGAYEVERMVMTPIVAGMPAEIEQYATMEEALASCQGSRVFLEPHGTRPLNEMPTTGDITFVFGNAKMHNLLLADPEEMFVIACPHDTDMYATNAAAVALAWHYGQ